LPQTEEEVVDFVEGAVVLAVIDLARGGFSSSAAWRLILPAEDFGDLLGEGEGVEGFEENAGEAEACEAALVDSLDLAVSRRTGIWLMAGFPAWI